VAFSLDGVQLASAYEEYPLLFPFPGAAELDSRLVAGAALRVVSQVTAQTAGDPPRAVGIASQGEAFTPIDAQGRPLANIMTSSDTRGLPYIEAFVSRIGAERLHAITGHTAHPMHSVFKLLWLKSNRPDVWSRTHRLLFAQDLVAHALTGEVATDHSMAARSMLFDVGRREWSAELLAAAELPIERMPAARPAGTPIGTVLPGVARDAGLRPDTVVTLAGHDQPVGALGCGAHRPGAASYAIGTVVCVTPALDRFSPSPALRAANLAVYPHVVPDTYTTVAYNLTGGSAIRWLRDHLFPELAQAARDAGAEPYERLIALASPRPSTLLLLPHFGPTGTPHNEALTTGVLAGLTLSTERSDIVRAFLEGVAYEIRWNLDILADAGLPVQELRAIGGGSRSPSWMQITADILGVPLTTMRVSEATCMGAALLAAGALGVVDAADAAAVWAKPERLYRPDAAVANDYAARFAAYKALYHALDPVRAQLHSLKGHV
jgi:xylulokinase